MPDTLVRLVILGLAILLQGCAMAGSPTPANANGTHPSEVLLSKLKECLAAVRAAPDNDDFTSPCVHLDVASLTGVTIAQLKSSLGAPGISSDDYVSVPNDPSAPRPPYECRWAFYRLNKAVMGGGPELQCESADRRTCTRVRWV